MSASDFESAPCLQLSLEPACGPAPLVPAAALDDPGAAWAPEWEGAGPALQPDLFAGPRSRGSRLIWVGRGRRLAMSGDLSDALSLALGREDGGEGGEGAAEFQTSPALRVDAALDLLPDEWVMQVSWQDLTQAKDDELYAEIDALPRASYDGSDAGAPSASGGGASDAGGGSSRGAGAPGPLAPRPPEPRWEAGAGGEAPCVGAVLTTRRLVVVDDHMEALFEVDLKSCR